MIKEISEQPQVLRHLSATTQTEIDQLASMLADAETVYVTGCGTANNAGLAAQYMFAQIAKRQVTAVMASEMAVAEPALLLIDPYPWSAPYEELRLRKTARPEGAATPTR